MIDFNRLDELFHRALELPPEARREFAEAQCRGQAELRAELLGMLAAEEDDPQDRWIDDLVAAAADELTDESETLTQTRVDFLVDRADPPPWPTEDVEGQGSVGPYRILELLGRGGLGTVFRAERGDEEYSRQVALKLVRRGLESPQIHERFRLERQILASLDHPHIARLYDGGTTADRRPYFVMELIEGLPLDVWCRERALPLNDRLTLMRKVCDAVHYAHRNLVLHRDLKPSNILVNESGEPKLLDFGIAKILHAEVPTGEPGQTGSTPVPHTPPLTLTETGHLLLTPEFAAPEQLRAETLTTATDVYALGMLLYLLVTGSPAYVLDRRRPAEVERIVCHEEPERPSSVARREEAQAAPGWSPPTQGDDLDNVICKALRKEPGRRYGSPAELAEDLRRYMENLPVAARPDTFSYRARKFIRRHRVPMIAASLVFLSLVAGVAGTTWMAKEAIQARRASDEVSRLLINTYEVADPTVEPDQLTVRELLDHSVDNLRREVPDNPRLQARLLGTLGRVHLNLSQFDDADALLQEAIGHLRALNPLSPDLVDWLIELAALRIEQNRLPEATALLDEALTLEPRRLTAADSRKPRILRGLGEVAGAQERWDEAESRLQEALEIADETHHGIERAQILDEQGKMWLRRQQIDRAEALFRSALDLRRRLLGDNHPRIGDALNNLGTINYDRGNFAEAAEFFRQALEVLRSSLGPRHAFVATTLQNLAHSLLNQGEIQAAELGALEALEVSRQAYGDDHPSVARCFRLLATVRSAQAATADRQRDPQTTTKRLREAEAMARQALEIDRAQFGEEHTLYVDNMLLLAGLLVRQERPEAAELYRRATEILGRIAPKSRRYADALVGSGMVEAAAERWTDAEVYLRRGLDHMVSIGVDGDQWQPARARGLLALSLEAQGRRDEARQWLDEALPGLRRGYPNSRMTRRLEDLDRRLQEPL